MCLKHSPIHCRSDFDYPFKGTTSFKIKTLQIGTVRLRAAAHTHTHTHTHNKIVIIFLTVLPVMEMYFVYCETGNIFVLKIKLAAGKYFLINPQTAPMPLCSWISYVDSVCCFHFPLLFYLIFKTVHALSEFLLYIFRLSPFARP
jgi:hypothetical protein